MLVSISFLASLMRFSPSLVYSSLMGTRRNPEGLAILTSAPRQSSAAGVSAEKAAQHFLPPGATWQRSPSFLMQKPHDFRHCNDWLYQRQRVSRQMLPPMVPMLRKIGDATVFTASWSTG